MLPGLIDSHVHPNGAAMTEFDHAIPDMESIADVLAYVGRRAKVVPAGEWIVVRQVFITRLKEQRYPTRRELDEAAPKNPVLFATGPDASLNTLALKRSKIDKDFKVADGGAGFAEKDAKTGEPTGILRSCTRYVDVGDAAGRKPTEADSLDRLTKLFADYNAVGLTAIVRPLGLRRGSGPVREAPRQGPTERARRGVPRARPRRRRSSRSGPRSRRWPPTRSPSRTRCSA